MPSGPVPIPVLCDVEGLLDRSMPRRRGVWVWPIGFGALGVVVSALLVAANHPETAPAMRVMSGLAVFGFFIAYALVGYLAAQDARQQRLQLDAVEELVMLRRWPDAAGAVTDLLSRPLAGHGTRVQALVFFASVLSRYHQYADAIAVHEHLIATVEMPPSLAMTVRIARAMALLHEDRLLDADRAINELRRMPNAADVAGVGLVELYRDVKTGHPREAIELFDARVGQFGSQLGHRAADAYVLVSKAFTMIGDESRARACYERATLLAPPGELARRYPDVKDLLGKYPPAAAPPEAA